MRPSLAWCDTEDTDALARGSLQTWTAGLLAAGRSPATAKTRQMAVRHFTRRLADESEIADNPFAGMKPPKGDQPVIPVLTEEQIKALIKACQPAVAEERTGLASLRHRRDEALVRLMSKTGLRASECINLEHSDVDMTKAPRSCAAARVAPAGRSRWRPDRQGPRPLPARPAAPQAR